MRDGSGRSNRLNRLCLWAAFSACLLITLNPEPARASGKAATVIVDSANLREEPSLGSKPARSVSRGTVLAVTDEFTETTGNKWHKVKTADGKHLWIADKVVRLTPAGGTGPVVQPLRELMDSADKFFREGRCEDFIAVNLKAIRTAEAQKDLRMRGKLHYNIAECYTRLKKHDEAAKHLENAVRIGNETGDSELEILALIDKSRVLVIAGDGKAASETLKTASEKAGNAIFLNSASGDYLKALAAYQMANVLLGLKETEGAKEKLDYALMVNHDFKLEEDIVGLLKAADTGLHNKISAIKKMLDEAWSAYEKGDYGQMEKLSVEALAASKRLSYKRGVFGGNYYLAMSYVNMDRYDNALDHVLHARELAEKGNDITRLGMIYNLTGNIFREKKSHEKALYYYNKTLDIARKNGDSEGEATTLNNMGNILMDKAEHGDALRYYEAALKLGLHSGAGKHIVAQSYLSIGRSQKRTGDRAGAAKNLAAAMDLFREMDNRGGELVCLWEIAGNYALQGDYRTAIRVLEDNLDRARKAGLEKSFVDDILDYAEKDKDFLKAEKYRKKENYSAAGLQ